MEDVQLEDVAYPIYIMENWYPKYSICSIPENYKGKIPEHWKKLCEPMPAGYHLTEIDELNFKNIKASYSKDFSRESHAFTIEGFVKEPIKNIFFTNIDFPCSDFGSVKYVDNLEFENSRYPEPKENYSDVETTQLD